MGHTVTSQRRIVDRLSKELGQYAKSLRAQDREIFEQIIKRPYQYIGSMTYANSIHTWAMMLMCIIIEQEKKLRDVEQRYHVMANGLLPKEQSTRVLAKNKND